MEDEIRRCTTYVIGRNCSFAGLAIVLVAVARADDPALALDMAGILNLVMMAILLLVAVNASGRDYRRTEVWALLKARGTTLPPTAAHKLISTVRRETCVHFARYATVAAAVFLAMGTLWAMGHPATALPA
jgi:hypothetical protein